MAEKTRLSLLQSTSDKLKTVDFMEGRLMMSTDTNELFYDPIGKTDRIKISDFIVVDDIEAIDAPYVDKLYFDTKTNRLIKFSSTDDGYEQIVIGNDGGDGFVTYNEYNERNEVISQALNQLFTDKATIDETKVVVETVDNKTYTFKQGSTEIGSITTGEGNVKTVNGLTGDIVLNANNIAMSEGDTTTVAEMIGDISTILDKINGETI